MARGRPRGAQNRRRAGRPRANRPLEIGEGEVGFKYF